METIIDNSNLNKPLIINTLENSSDSSIIKMKDKSYPLYNKEENNKQGKKVQSKANDNYIIINKLKKRERNNSSKNNINLLKTEKGLNIKKKLSLSKINKRKTNDYCNNLLKKMEEQKINIQIINKEKNEKDEIKSTIKIDSQNLKLNENNKNICKKNNKYENVFGFNNIGNTCYINSFMQILFHTPNFLKELKKVKNEKHQQNLNLIDDLIGLSEDPKNDKYIRDIKKLMGNMEKSFGEYCQNDSQEFGTGLLEQIIVLIKGKINFIEDETREIEITPSNLKEISNELFKKYKEKYFNEEKLTFLEKMFQFHESTIKKITEGNGHIKIKDIDFNSYLSVDLSFPENTQKSKIYLINLIENKYLYYTLEKDIETKNEIFYKNDNLNQSLNFEETTPNKGQNNQTDDNCILYLIKKIINFFKNTIKNIFNRDNNAYQNIKELTYTYETKFASLPEILILNINRAINGKPLYNNTLIIEDILDLNKFVDENIYNNKSTKYKLYAINKRSGITQDYGHYYSYAKINDIWYYFNDCSFKQEEPNYSSKEAVGLYYKRI